MYGSEHYQVTDMSSTSSAYNYYPNYHNHSHLHLNHMHHNPTADILSGSQSHSSNQLPTGANSSNLSAGMYHEYGITMEPGFYETDSSNSVAHSYYQNQSNLNDHTSSHHTTSSSSSSNDILPEPSTSHIISSDNGLSYTNLDYIYGQAHSNSLYLHQTDDKSIISHAYSSVPSVGNIEANNLHSQQHSALWQSQNATQLHANNQHHVSGYLENSVNNHQVGLNQISCLQNQTTLNTLGTSANEILNNRNLSNRNDSRANNVAQQNTQPQTQPTYKWMQVKRNVPKPQGKRFI